MTTQAMETRLRIGAWIVCAAGAIPFAKSDATQ